MPLSASRFPQRLAAAGHLLGFLSASFLIDNGMRSFQGASAGGSENAGEIPLQAATRVPSLFLEIPEGIFSAPLFGLLAILLAAVLEELFYRGLVFEGVLRFKGFASAIVISAALFAIAHPGLQNVAAAGLLGLYLGALRATRGLLLPVLGHSANNGLAWALSPAPAWAIPGIGSATAGIAAWPLAGLCLGAVGISLAALRQEMRSLSAEADLRQTRPSANS